MMKLFITNEYIFMIIILLFLLYLNRERAFLFLHYLLGNDGAYYYNGNLKSYRFYLPQLYSPDSNTATKIYKVIFSDDIIEHQFYLYNTSVSFKAFSAPQRLADCGVTKYSRHYTLDKQSTACVNTLQSTHIFTFIVENFERESTYDHVIGYRHTKIRDKTSNNKPKIEFDEFTVPFIQLHKNNDTKLYVNIQPTKTDHFKIYATDHYDDLVKIWDATFNKDTNDWIVTNLMHNNSLVSNKKLYTLNGNDYDKNETLRLINELLIKRCNVCKFNILWFLTHKAMHSLNGNTTQVTVKTNNKKKNKQNKNNNNNALQITPFRKDNRVKRKQRNRKTIVQPRRYLNFNGQRAYDLLMPLTRKWLNAVVNPIHYIGAVTMPDPNVRPCFPFIDFEKVDFGMSVTIDGHDNSNPAAFTAYGCLFYLTYGPTEYITDDVRAWRLCVVPYNNMGMPLVWANGTVPTLGGANYVSIWNDAVSARVWAMGVRVNSLIDMATTTDQMYLARLTAGQLRSRDFEKWLANETTVTNITETSFRFQTYTNAQGASSRYNPLQVNPDQQKYYTEGELKVNSGDADPFNTHDIYFPYVNVVFSEAIIPTAPTSTALHKNKLINVMAADTINKLKIMNLEPKVKPTKGEVNRLYKNYIEEQKTVSAVGPLEYALPVFLEFKIWGDYEITLPNYKVAIEPSIQSDWAKIVELMHSGGVPMVSDGHSFHNFAKMLGNQLRVRNIRKNFGYAAGVIRASKTGMSDIRRALMH